MPAAVACGHSGGCLVAATVETRAVTGDFGAVTHHEGVLSSHSILPPEAHGIGLHSPHRPVHVPGGPLYILNDVFLI